MNVTLDAGDFAQLADLWRRGPDVTREELLAAMTDADVLLQGELMQQLPAGAGGAAGLRGSVFRKEESLADNVIGVVASGKPYAAYVELGTKPHTPPIQPLIDWVEAVLGLRDVEAKGAAFAISRSIGARGTKPNPVWRIVWAQQRDAIRRKFDAAVTRIAGRLGSAA